MCISQLKETDQGRRHLSKKKKKTWILFKSICREKTFGTKFWQINQKWILCGYTGDLYANQKHSTEEVKVQSMEVKTAGFAPTLLRKSLVYQNELHFKAGKMYRIYHTEYRIQYYLAESWWWDKAHKVHYTTLCPGKVISEIKLHALQCEKWTAVKSIKPNYTWNIMCK